jgi:hypothetical protein
MVAAVITWHGDLHGAAMSIHAPPRAPRNCLLFNGFPPFAATGSAWYFFRPGKQKTLRKDGALVEHE